LYYITNELFNQNTIDMTKAQLVNAAKDLNEMLGLNPPIDVTATVAVLKDTVKEGGLWLQETDEPKPKTIEVLKGFTWEDADFEDLEDDQKDIEDVFNKLGILGEPEEEAPEEVEPEEATEPAVKKPKAAGKKKVGVIATIVALIEKAPAKGVSKDTILEKLLEKFPERGSIPMKATINVQVPGRISKEKFPVEKLDNGNYRKAK